MYILAKEVILPALNNANKAALILERTPLVPPQLTLLV